MTTKHLLIVGLAYLLHSTTAFSQTWYKGNLHTHSLWSDGDDYPEMIMDWYKANGYHFVGLSDHNTFQEGERWIQVPKAPSRRRVFERYLRNFGKDWVHFRTLPGDTLEVRLKTLPEYQPYFEEAGKFLILKSEEITSRYFGRPIHINATNVQEYIAPATGSSVAHIMQQTIDAVYAQRKATGIPMIAHINHPNFVWGVSAEDIMEVRGERFFEVFNGHPSVYNYGDSARMGTEEMWDRINFSYLQQQKPLLYGLATDDSHNYFLFGPTYSNSGRGWVMVQASELSPSALIQSMEAGQFYASTGVTLDSLYQESNRIYLRVQSEPSVQYTIQFKGWKKGGSAPTLLATHSGTEAAYIIQPDDLFVRATVISSKPKFNPYQPGDVEQAWTQPIRYQKPN